MLLTPGNLSIWDYGEEGLTAKLLVGLLLNEHAPCNRKLRAFRSFLKAAFEGCDGWVEEQWTQVSTEDFQIHYEPKRIVENLTGGGQKKNPDLIITHSRMPNRWICGIETKYLDEVTSEQLEEEYEAILRIANHKKVEPKYHRHYLLVIAAEKRLKTSHKWLTEKVQRHIDRGQIRFLSWETVIKILGGKNRNRLRSDLSIFLDSLFEASEERVLRTSSTRALRLRIVPDKKFENASQWRVFLVDQSRDHQGLELPSPAEFVCQFKGIGFKAETGRPGRKGFVLANWQSNMATLVGDTTVRHYQERDKIMTPTFEPVTHRDELAGILARFVQVYGKLI